MIIYNFHSPSHKELAQLLKRSAVSKTILVQHEIPIESAGDYGDETWRDINLIGLHLFCFAIANLLCKCGVVDSDVLILRPFETEVLKLLQDYDILFQHERDGLWNPGITFLNARPKVEQAYRNFALMFHKWDGHLPHQNELMREAFKDCKVGLLPDDFAANPSNSGDVKKCALYHFNSTPPPGSVQKKLKMMKELIQ